MIGLATRLLRYPTVNRALRLLARARGHRLVLVYHRVGPSGLHECEIVPSVPAALFRTHLQALGEVVDLVGVDEIIENTSRHPADNGGRRPAVALTFDDDLPSHTAQVLPVLRELGIPAAFFLSGRALHGLGSYWFQQLEALQAAQGKARTAAMLGLRANQADAVAITCEHDTGLRKRIVELAAQAPEPGILQADGIVALRAAGMTIGFHTVDHILLRGMDEGALAHAVSFGREQLAAAAGMAVRYFAYPYGKADTAAAAAVRRAGFEAAFTGHPEPLRPRGDRYRLGRWEPGPLGVDDLLVRLAVRFHRAAPQPARVA